MYLQVSSTHKGWGVGKVTQKKQREEYKIKAQENNDSSNPSLYVRKKVQCNLKRTEECKKRNCVIPKYLKSKCIMI
jgi:hypothetical protein